MNIIMKLCGLLLFILLHVSSAELLTRNNEAEFPPAVTTYQGDIPRHKAVIRAIQPIPRAGPITDEQAAAVQGNLTALHKNLNAMYKVTTKSKKFNKKTSDKMADILETIAGLGDKLFDQVVNRREAWVNADILDYVCANIKQACDQIQRVLDAFILKATPDAAERAKKLKALLASRCAETLKGLGCK